MRHKTACLVSLILFIFAFGDTRAQTPDELFEAANQAYLQKDFERAVSSYEQLLELGYTNNATLLYNLGNAYAAQERIGMAIWMYERALQIRPRDRAIRQNLRFAQNKVREWIEPEPVFFLKAWWQAIRQQMSVNAWAVLALAFIWFALSGALVYLFARQRTLRKWGFVAGVFFAVSMFLPLSMAWSGKQAAIQLHAAIVVDPKTELYSAPDTGSQNIMPLSEGIRLRLTDYLSNWYKVRLGNGTEGWVEEQAIGKF